MTPAGCCAAATSLALAVFAVDPGNVVLFVAAAVVIGAAYNAVVAIWGLWSVTVYADRPSTGISAVMISMTVGMILGPVAAGPIVGMAGHPTAFSAAAAVVDVALVLAPPPATTVETDQTDYPRPPAQQSASSTESSSEIRLARMTSRIAVIAIDARDPERVAEFWAAALGWEAWPESDGVSLAPPGMADTSGIAGPSIDVFRVPDHKVVKNRLHFDLRADGSSQVDEVSRLVNLGATRVDVGQDPDVSWVVLADPEGNEFCVLARSVQEADTTSS